MKNFFNAIGVFDMERVHSAMIGWILDDENDITSCNCTHGSNFSTFPIKERSEILCALFRIEDSRIFKIIRTHIEWNDIDLVIETEDEQGQEIWVIENKLKSWEHKSNHEQTGMIWQSEKYVDFIDNKFPQKSHHFMLLSLGGDIAHSETKDWISYTYDELQETLATYLICPSKYVLVNEYWGALNKMVTELRKFLCSSDFSIYSNVFHKQKKEQKEHLNQSGAEIYILENGLETICQRLFLKKMIDQYLPCISRNNIHYDERNGIAMFVYFVGDVTSDLKLQIEFQGGTYKVVLIHKRYEMPKAGDYKSIYGDYSNKWDGKGFQIFSNYSSRKSAPKGWKLELSKNISKAPKNSNINPKPRIALDRSIGNDWYNKPFSFIEGFNEALSITADIKKDF